MISGPPNEMKVEMRRKLAGPDQVEAFKADLVKKIDEARAAANGKHPAMVFHDFDISQNAIPVDDLCDIFNIMGQYDIHVVRLRLFGCPTMNDEAAMMLANWFAGCSDETAPLELHLSDCVLTTIGFLSLTGAIRDNPAFPPVDPVNGKRGPMYLRIENNYIDQETLTDVISEGTCCTFTKKNWGWGSWGQAHYAGAVPEGTKIKLLTGEDHVSHQRKGEPPPLEQIRYKNVFDWAKGGKDVIDGTRPPDKGKGKKGKDKSSDSSGKGYGNYGNYGKSDASQRRPRTPSPKTNRDHHRSRDDRDGSRGGDRDWDRGGDRRDRSRGRNRSRSRRDRSRSRGNRESRWDQRGSGWTLAGNSGPSVAPSLKARAPAPPKLATWQTAEEIAEAAEIAAAEAEVAAAMAAQAEIDEEIAAAAAEIAERCRRKQQIDDAEITAAAEVAVQEATGANLDLWSLVIDDSN